MSGASLPVRLVRLELSEGALMVDYSASYATADRDQTRTLFGNVMWLVAAAAGFFALG